MSAQTPEPLADEHHRLLFMAAQSIRYHSKRQVFFTRINKAFTFLAAFAGSGAVALALSEVPKWGVATGMAVAFCSTISLVFDFPAMAFQAANLRCRWIELERRMQRMKLTQAAFDDLKDERAHIEADEGPNLVVLTLICHNEEVRAQGHGQSYSVQLSWLQRVMAPWRDIQVHKVRNPVAAS